MLQCPFRATWHVLLLPRAALRDVSSLRSALGYEVVAPFGARQGHIHIHVIMTAGGMSIPAKPQLTEEGTPEEPSPMKWIPIPLDAPSMENEALALEFRKRFVRGLKLLY